LLYPFELRGQPVFGSSLRNSYPVDKQPFAAATNASVFAHHRRPGEQSSDCRREAKRPQLGVALGVPIRALVVDFRFCPMLSDRPLAWQESQIMMAPGPDDRKFCRIALQSAKDLLERA
jgi:hypothetical protein